MWRSRTALAIGTIGTVVALALAGCGASKAKTPSSTPNGTITVLAASSLTEVFTQLGKDFETAHPGTHVTFSFGASSTLAQQITQGAPADVFASASPATMKLATDANDADGTPAVFVRNQLVIAVPPNNPKGITSLADLTKPGLKVVLCAAAVPCGAAAVTALAAGNVTLTPVSYEQDVKAALGKVELGEADAALVYRTDAKSSGGKVVGVEFPESAQAINNYPIVALKGSKNLVTARAFVAFIESAPALAELTAAGFQAP